MGKTPSPGKWIKTLLGKKSSKSSLEKGSEKLRSAKKGDLVVKVKDDASNLPTNPPVVSSQDVAATATQTLVVPDVVVVEKQPSEETNLTVSQGHEGVESNVNLQSGNDSEEFKLEEAATKVQAAFRAHQARGTFQSLKGIIKIQAVIRGHLVRRQAVATYSCIWGIVKLQALVRGKKARSSETGMQLLKTHTDTVTSQSLEESTISWLENPTKFSMVDKLLVSSLAPSTLKLQYGCDDPNSAKVWLERWTQLQVWAPGSRVVKSPVPKSQMKKRNYQALEADKGKLKRGIKKPTGASTGNGSNRSTAEIEKPKRNVRKASTLVKELPRIETDKARQSSRKSTSAIKEGSSSEVKEEKPRTSLKKASLSNGIEKATRKSGEKKKEIADSVQKEPGDKVAASLVDAPEGVTVGSAEKVEDIPEAVAEVLDLDKEEKPPVLDNVEQDELKTAESSDKAEEIQELDVQISSENGNVASENTKPSDRRASLPAKIENQDDALTQSGRKIPSYMAPTASAKARVRGQGSPRITQEKPEKNGATRRHSLPSAANGKLNTMSPRAHRLLIASAKGSMNSDRSFSSSKDIGDKSTKAEWKR